MREFCFRGKVTAEYAENHALLLPGDWVSGGILPLPNFTFILCDSGTERAPVDPETVGQFTGMNDRNGKPIFEGDIIRTSGRNPELWEIRWIERYARFAAWRPGTVFAVSAFEMGEVVGNVHDNPDLLTAVDTPEARIGRLKKGNGLEVTQ